MAKKFSFDINEINKIIKKLSHPQASNDLMRFLENLPNQVGNTVLAIGGIAWLVAGAALMYASVQSQQIANMRAEIMNTEALKPPVPKVRNINVNATDISAFIEKANKEYKGTGVTITDKSGKIEIKGDSSRQYGVFREAVGHIQNGGPGWRVSVEELCVGRECNSQQGGRVGAFLYGVFGVSRVDIEMPQL